MSKTLSKAELVGHIGVDAGLCWIGDPCYVLHKDKTPESLGKDWGDFCDLLGDDYPTKKEFNLGVCVSTGYGDGTYPVYVKRNTEGRIVRVIIKFD